MNDRLGFYTVIDIKDGGNMYYTSWSLLYGPLSNTCPHGTPWHHKNKMETAAEDQERNMLE